jgi:DnaK suppressor protein
MDPNRLIELRELLTRKREALVKKIEDRQRKSRSTEREKPEDNGHVSRSEQDAINFELSRLDHEQLGRIDAARGRLEAGTYGNCLEPKCGEEISVSRLDAVPFAVRCTDCEEAREDEDAPGRKRRRGRDIN